MSEPTIRPTASLGAAAGFAQPKLEAIERLPLVERLTSIWKRVLQLPSIGVDDNFFELGGDSALALALFHEIATAFGRELPPVVIYHAPTISALASLLHDDNAPTVPALVRLRAGSEDSPLFVTHGLGGSVMDFFQVVRRIEASCAIYGIQMPGIDGIGTPFDRIEDIACYAIDSMRQFRPRGPYCLVGYSLGGLVTLEMAQRLTAQGEKIALLAMLDSYPDIRYLSLAQRARLTARLTARRAAAALRAHRPPVKEAISPAMQRVRSSAYLALARYRPRFYPGKIRFVRAAIPTDFPSNARAVWAHLAAEFEMTTVSGDHLGMMTTHFDALAVVLSSFLKSAHG